MGKEEEILMKGKSVQKIKKRSNIDVKLLSLVTLRSEREDRNLMKNVTDVQELNRNAIPAATLLRTGAVIILQERTKENAS